MNRDRRLWVGAVGAIIGTFGLGMASVVLNPAVTGTASASALPNHPLVRLYRDEVAARSDPTPALALEIGRALWTMGSPDDAAALLERASALPESARALAETAISLGAWDRAERALIPLARSESADAPWAALQLGMLRAAVDPAAARADLQRAAIEPGYARTASRLIAALEVTSNPTRIALVLGELGAWDHAAHALIGVNADPVGLALMALARTQQGKDGGGYLDAALTLAPDDPQVRLLHGLTARAAGDYPASRDALVAATALDPDDPLLYAELGTAYQLLGDLVSAERWLTFAVELSNGDARITARLDALNSETEALVSALGLMTALAPDAPELESGR